MLIHEVFTQPAKKKWFFFEKIYDPKKCEKWFEGFKHKSSMSNSYFFITVDLGLIVTIQTRVHKNDIEDLGK